MTSRPRSDTSHSTGRGPRRERMGATNSGGQVTSGRVERWPPGAGRESSCDAVKVTRSVRVEPRVARLATRGSTRTTCNMLSLQEFGRSVPGVPPPAYQGQTPLDLCSGTKPRRYSEP